MQEYQNPEDLIGENGLLKEQTNALIEKAMQEMTQHVGYENTSRKDRKGRGEFCGRM